MMGLFSRRNITSIYQRAPRFFLFGQLSFPGKVRPIEWTPIRLSLEEVAVHIDPKVLMKIKDYISLIVVIPKGI
jgi:hypothetical protein